MILYSVDTVLSAFFNLESIDVTKKHELFKDLSKWILLVESNKYCFCAYCYQSCIWLLPFQNVNGMQIWDVQSYIIGTIFKSLAKYESNLSHLLRL